MSVTLLNQFPREDSAVLLKYIKEQAYGWIYSVNHGSPIEMYPLSFYIPKYDLKPYGRGVSFG